jgi:GntR family transcriptional regulator
VTVATGVKRLPATITAADPRMPTPLYHQIYLILREQIADGSIGSDATVPGEQELTRLYGVSRITAKRALDE